MDEPEPLIVHYDLAKWFNPTARGSNDVARKAMPLLAVNYTGLLRTAAGPVAVDGDDGDDADVSLGA